MTMLAEHWRIALGALRANWFRAFLTALGIVIGVASLIAVTAVSAGAQSEVSNSIRRLGGNVIKVDGEFISVGTRQTATDRTITPEDVAAIAKLPMVTAVAPHQDIESLVVSERPASDEHLARRSDRRLRRRPEPAGRGGTFAVGDRLQLRA